MTQGTTPPGWYDDGSGRQRWFDGTSWGVYQDEVQQAQPVSAPKKSNLGLFIGLGAVALVFMMIVGSIGMWALFFRNPLKGPYDDYITAMNKRDCDQLKEVTTSDFRDEYLSYYGDDWSDYGDFSCSSFEDMDTDYTPEAWGMTYEVTSWEVDGDKGTLEIKVSTLDDQDEPDGDRSTDNMDVKFVKEDGQWKIDNMK